MLIDGEWYACDDGEVRPVLVVGVLAANGGWLVERFLVDCGADCTLLAAESVLRLGAPTTASAVRLGGLGGLSDSVRVTTTIRLTTRDGGSAKFRSNYAALETFGRLDMSILGRDILDHFAVVVDRPGDRVCLVRPPHACHVA